MRNLSSVVRLAGFLAAALAAAPFTTGAQEQADSAARDTTATVSDMSGAQKLETVRVRGVRARSAYVAGQSRTGTKTRAELRDVPQSIVTIGAAAIRDNAMQGLSDVVRFVPGATMGQGEGNRDQITLRGNNSTADFFVDGVRDDAQYFRDLYNVEKIEALKGPNAMVFGRGGGGGILNRVTKEAGWRTNYQLTAEAGTFGGRRISGDLQRTISPAASARINSVYENSDLFRDGVYIERTGVNPTLTFASPSRRTRAALSFEYFEDRRTADRGIPSHLGQPVDADPETFFGNPEASWSDADVTSAGVTLSHDGGKVQVRNTTRLASYGKYYQNVFPGAVSADGSSVSISGYSNAGARTNVFNQTDVNFNVATGAVVHSFLVGAEVGRQSSDNFRSTAYFDGNATSVTVPVNDPVTRAAATFRQSASDADNDTRVTTASLYAQDQLSLSRYVKLVAGARYERFDLRFDDNRANAVHERADNMISPRAGIIIKPAELVSVYGSYSVSFLPGSGDQFASLTEVTTALEPERFTNYEAGLKWDVLDRLAFTAAAYRLDRTNTRSVDPANPQLLLQTGAQRTNGLELSATGNVTDKLEIVAGVASQSAKIVSATASSEAGARVPLVPRSTASLWSRYNVSPRFGIGMGALHQSSMFAGIDNKVELPSFQRFDAAVFARLGWGLSAQLNVENLLDTRYFPTAHSNNNITPGSPRAARLSVTADF